MFTWTVSESIASSASPQAVWNLWKDVQKWPQWDTHLEWSRLEGDFAVNTSGSLKPKGRSPVQFTLVEVVPGKNFTTRSHFAMTTMTFGHTIALGNAGISITHTAKISGLLAPILYFAMRKDIITGFKDALQRLSKMAQSQNV